jgi:hypothetical protein
MKVMELIKTITKRFDTLICRGEKETLKHFLPLAIFIKSVLVFLKIIRKQ